MIVPRRRIRDTFLPWVQLLVDCVAIQLTLKLVFWFRFISNYFDNKIGPPDFHMYQNSFILFNILLVLFLRQYGLYRPAKLFTFSGESIKVCKAAVMTMIVLMAMTFFFRDFSFSRIFLVMSGVVLAVTVSLARYVLGLGVMEIDKARGSFRNILAVGYDENLKKLIKFYKKNPRFSTRVVGFLDDERGVGATIEGVPVVGRLNDLESTIRSRRQIHEVILAASGISNEYLLKTIAACEKEMVAVRWIADIFGLITSKMNVAYLSGVPVLSFSDSPLADWENRILKRSFDVVLSLGALLILSPLYLILILLMKMTSQGPVFYKQQRIGEDGRRFVLYKFRTMRVDAEKETGPVWAKKNDSRRTPMGTFLRENNLDELPQLWNVLIGDMSLVGPRPERPFFVSQFKEDIPRYMARHTIKSGITGWAQVNGLRGNTSIEERTKYDLYYIENWSLFFDFKILVMTFFAKANAY